MQVCGLELSNNQDFLISPLHNTPFFPLAERLTFPPGAEQLLLLWKVLPSTGMREKLHGIRPERTTNRQSRLSRNISLDVVR